MGKLKRKNVYDCIWMNAFLNSFQLRWHFDIFNKARSEEFSKKGKHCRKPELFMIFSAISIHYILQLLKKESLVCWKNTTNNMKPIDFFNSVYRESTFCVWKYLRKHITHKLICGSKNYLKKHENLKYLHITPYTLCSLYSIHSSLYIIRENLMKAKIK